MVNTITFNPAMDKIFFIQSLKVNNTNRIKGLSKSLGGKGTHIAINLSMLGMQNRTFGVSFGETGKEIIDTLKNAGVETHYLWYEKPESRTNYIFIDEEKNCTMFTEQGERLSEDTLGKLLELIQNNIRHNDGIVISGDGSNVDGQDILKRIMKMANDFNARIYLDSSGKFLKEAIPFKPFLIKPNMDELCELTGRKIRTLEDIVSVMDELADIPAVMVSMGKDGSVLRYGHAIYRSYGVEVDVVNTIGCGDALLSGIVLGFETNMNIIEMLKLSTAISASCAMTEKTVGFDNSAVQLLKEKVHVEIIRN